MFPFCFPSTRLPFFLSLKFFMFPFDALTPSGHFAGRAGPLLSAPAESRQRQAQGSFTPLRIPGPKWGAGRPLWKPPSLAALSGLAELLAASRLELRCRWGKRERMRARYDRRTSTASGWGLAPPCPPRFPNGDVCLSCAHAHGTAFVLALRATPSQISRKLLPRSG